MGVVWVGTVKTNALKIPENWLGRKQECELGGMGK